MGLTSALYNTLTGLNANQQRLDVIGNNISNVNTVGFKSSRLDFESLFAQTISNGAPPSADSGGTNPVQIGLGTKNGAVTRNFTDGSRNVTGVNTDLAIEGDGFFVLQGIDQVFTRDGTFKLNSENKLTNANGDRVQGYAVDSNYNVIKGPMTDLIVPLGGLTIASATTSVTLKGDLNAQGTIATTASTFALQQPFYKQGAGAVDPVNPPAAADDLTTVVDAANVPLFQVGDVITITGKKGANSVVPKSLTVQGGATPTTVQDYLNFINGTLGINTTAGANGAFQDGGATLTTVTPATATFPSNSQQLVITGNLGNDNALTLNSSSISIQRGAVSPLVPFSFSAGSAANGESAVSSAQIYDSLGAPVRLLVTATLVGRNSSGTTWQYIVNSPDTTTGNGAPALGLGTQTMVGSGTMQFDTNGRLIGSPTTTVTIDRSNTGAAPLLAFSLGFSDITSLSQNSTSTSTGSTLVVSNYDGSAKGVLNNFSIGNDGAIVGGFSNGEKRTLGQVVLATFRNNQGLLDKGNNSFVPGSNSGPAQISVPGTLSAVSIVAGTLELSNVDLSQEFVNLISASTGFSA
ncbi:MAG: flagellar hook-basal body complex protein, partial [Phycisphaerae bacterium]